MRWIVSHADAGAVRQVLLRAGADADAVRDGRVFIGRRRVRRDDELVRGGDVVQVAPPRAASPAAVRVLARTSDLVAVDKPAGIPTIPDQSGGAHALVSLTQRAVGVSSPLHVTSRLDRDVSGVVVFARTAEAALRLRRARAEGAYERRYVAIAASAPAAESGAWTAPIGRGRDPRLREVAGPHALAARTLYAVCSRSKAGPVLIAVRPVTGRTHQIRLHAADAGAPLVGDRAYGGPARITLASGRVVEPRRIALHAATVQVPDEHESRLVVNAPIPEELSELWVLLGGDADAWQRAIQCALG